MPPRTRNTSKNEAKQMTAFKPAVSKKQVYLALPISHVQFGRIGEDSTDLYHVFRENVPGFTVQTKDDILNYFDEDEHAYATWEKFLHDCKTEALKPLVPEPLPEPPQPLVPEPLPEPPQPLVPESPQPLPPRDNDTTCTCIAICTCMAHPALSLLGYTPLCVHRMGKRGSDVIEAEEEEEVPPSDSDTDLELTAWRGHEPETQAFVKPTFNVRLLTEPFQPIQPEPVPEPLQPIVMPALEPFDIKQAEHVANSMESVLARYGLNAVKTLMNLTDAQVEKFVHVLRELDAASTTRDIAGVGERIVPAFYLSPAVLVEPTTVFTEERTQLFDTAYGVVGIKDKQIYGPLLVGSSPLSAATFDRSHVGEKKISGLIMVRYLYKREPNITVNGCTKKICNFCRRLTTGLVNGTCEKCKCIYCGRPSRKDICDPCNFSMYLQTSVELEMPIRAKCGNLLFAYEADNKAIRLEERRVELEHEREVELVREIQRKDAMADIVAAAVKNGVSAEVAKNIAQTMITPDVVKNAKPVDVAGDDNESTEELDESEGEEPMRRPKLEKDLKRVRGYRKRKREEMGEEAYKAMNREYNRDYRARRKQKDAEEARRLAVLEEKHP